MPSALETLVKILKLERDRGYKNDAVIGGLGAFAENWKVNAHQQVRQDAQHFMVDDLAQLLTQYDHMENRTDRHEVITYALDRAMFRRADPRPNYTPSYDWQTAAPPEVPAAPPPAPAPVEPPVQPKLPLEAPEAPKRKPKAARAESPAATPKTAATPRKAKPTAAPRGKKGEESSGGEENIFREVHDTELEIAFRGAVRPDMPPELRLTRPPRRRTYHDPQAAADLMHGLRQPVSKIRGVGDKLAELLAKLGINTLEDLLYNLPRRYDDYTRLLPIARLEPNEDLPVTIIGTVRTPHLRAAAGGRKDFACTLDDGTARLQLLFFGQQWMQTRVREGDQWVVSGKVNIFRNAMGMSNPEWEPLDNENLQGRGIVPVYPLTKGLNSRRLRKLMQETVGYWAERIPDYIPTSVLDRNELADLGWALKNIHFPEGNDHLLHAQRRLAFDELLLMQLAIMSNRRDWQSVRAVPLSVWNEWLAEFLPAVFPYPLTRAQRRSIDEIRTDVGLSVPMNRLVQGDVGSGKTAVAIVALAFAFANGQQAALMAPTSILAEQHFQGVSAALAKMPGEPKPRVGLLTGAMTKSAREATYAGLADGSIDVIIGTHALIQSNVAFKHLAVAVIDEQHRFGVEQRGALRGKGHNPHLLVMTATPIPRTLALTMYADLDLSVIDEMPPGRTPIRTSIHPPLEREACYSFIKGQLSVGRQAFIVHPLVEASEKVEAASAVEAYDALQVIFHQHRVGLLHGKMKSAEKDQVMAAFAAHEFDILVTTSVAEVGVNIPNASVMMIEGANRFGLAQLHQFRGRVGRGQHPGYCLLIPDTVTAESEARLEIMVETTDGFVLAQKDWEMRGAGDLLSINQSGTNKLQLAAMYQPELVELTLSEARTLYQEDIDLARDDHALLRQRVR
ncbi:MAG: ATP-dependent DNA helicase RecG, partial [Phototrophicaceae bacterium]